MGSLIGLAVSSLWQVATVVTDVMTVVTDVIAYGVGVAGSVGA